MDRVPPSAAEQLSEIVADVAAATALREGPAGAWEVLRQIARHAVSVRELSRRTGLPVPVVAAVCAELRTRGVLAQTRPARLSPHGRALTRALQPVAGLSGDCEACGGNGALPPRAAPLARALERAQAAMPAADMALDQAHCTVETKLRRALHLLDHGRLAAGPLLFLGDDDLTSLAVALLAREAGLLAALPPLAVVDVDARVAGFLERELGEIGARASVHVHDAREPLPDALLHAFATVVTDPPYTVAGATLFLSRAVSALAGAGGEVLLCFGPKSPDEALLVERAATGMGLVTRALTRNFNEYAGAGTLGGVSHLHHLVATSAVAPQTTGAYAGPLYTGSRHRPRRYRCAACGREATVGPERPHATVGELKAAGCPACGGDRFRPLAREPAAP